MTPQQLEAVTFASYNQEARKLAGSHVMLFRSLPLAFLPLLLREIVQFDWKFPAERAELESELRYLEELPDESRKKEMQPFARLSVADGLAATDWVNDPARFSEQLSAHLWATHQIDAFRQASLDYAARSRSARVQAQPAISRLILVGIGRDAKPGSYPLFRKLRQYGSHYSQVDTGRGRETALKVLEQRAENHATPYAHWEIDGASVPHARSGISQLAYGELEAARISLVNRMRHVMAPGGQGPEALRTLMVRMTPGELGLPDGGDPILNHFRFKMLTEGSGTQLFSTSFVQWSAREALRRAQPLTAVINFAPRQREASMLDLVSGQPHQVELDPQGSLIDADMAAYYIWLSSRQLTSSNRDRFVAWHEGGTEAIVIGPQSQAGQHVTASVALSDLLSAQS